MINEITSAKMSLNEWTYFVLVPEYLCSRIRETRRMFICHYHVQRVEVTRAGGGCSLGLTIPGTISNFNISRGPRLTSRTLLPYHLTSTVSHMINMIWLDISVQELMNLWYLNMNIISLSDFIYFRGSASEWQILNTKYIYSFPWNNG